MTAAATAACPKHMEYGPCGGVRADGSCELGDRPCSFVGVPPVAWAGVDHAGAPPRPTGFTSAARRMRARLAAGPVVVADLAARPLSSASIAEVGAVLSGAVDAVLAGDSGASRVQLPPAYRAVLLRAAGLEPWSGLNCRDRNRVALEGELAGLADAGVGAVHCVTGDHTDTGHRPDAAPVFDLDATELAALARAAGLLVSVAEAPATPPAAGRVERFEQKALAGADVCFVDHCGGVAPAAAFRSAVVARGVEARFVACVPVVVDAGSAALLRSFTGLVLPPGYLEAIEAAPESRAAGIDAAVTLCRRFLDAGFDGVDLSGGPARGDEVPYAEALAEIGTRLRA